MKMHRRWEKPAMVVAGASVLFLLASPSTSPFVTTAKPAATQGTTGTDICVEPSTGQGNCSKTFGVTVGAVGPLYPRQTRQLPVTWSNPNNFDLVIDSYRVTVSVPQGTSSQCPPSSLVVPTGTVSPSPRIVVPSKGSTSTSVPVTLPNSVTDACQRVAFAVTVDATGVKR